MIHAGFFWFRTRKKALESAEPLNAPVLEEIVDNALVAFTSVEEGDSQCLNELREKVLKDIAEVIDEVKPSSIVLYPYAHLSNNLASPEEALEVLLSLEEGLKSYFSNLKITRAPFGWYKSFKIYCLGHPLSELSREYRPKELCLDRTTPYTCLLSKTTVEVNRSITDSVCTSLSSKERMIKLPGKINSLLKSFGLNSSRASKSKHYLTLRGKSLKIYSIIEEVNELILKSIKLNYDIIKVEGIIDSLINELQFFNPELINSSKKALLVKDMTRDPVGRLTPFPTLTESFLILERKTVNELHKVIQEALNIILKFYGTLSIKELFILNEGFQNVDLVSKLLKDLGWEYSIINIKTSSVTRFNTGIERIRIVAEPIKKLFLELGGFKIYRNGKSFMLGTNVLGVYENLILSALAKAVIELDRGTPPSIPLWLNPIQVKLLPVKEGHTKYAKEVMDELRTYGIRVSLDDRKTSLGRKIRDAGREWVPYIAVIGDREVKAEVLNVRIREGGRQISLTLEELTKLIKREDITQQIRTLLT